MTFGPFFVLCLLLASIEAVVNPVFLRQKDIPDVDNNRPTVLEMCLAAERSSGQGSVLGAQDIRGLWRIYPATKESRTELLVKGLRLRVSYPSEKRGVRASCLKYGEHCQKDSECCDHF
ncbi:uncharacterized protein LOC143274947 [Babylonia areolata]|uniref:uncharacterized protein LOC143274947 n=1 Tax=Babylonia areolata TaxID=304850 RepID=UPI003FD38A29